MLDPSPAIATGQVAEAKLCRQTHGNTASGPLSLRIENVQEDDEEREELRRRATRGKALMLCGIAETASQVPRHLDYIDMSNDLKKEYGYASLNPC